MTKAVCGVSVVPGVFGAKLVVLDAGPRRVRRYFLGTLGPGTPGRY